jgi:hypothetical protein
MISTGQAEKLTVDTIQSTDERPLLYPKDMSDKPVLRPWVRGVFVSAYLHGNGYPQGFPDVFVSVFPHHLSVS